MNAVYLAISAVFVYVLSMALANADKVVAAADAAEKFLQ